MANAFRWVKVNYHVEGGARVEWELSRRFLDPLPHTFRLQVALTSSPTADDWADVGLPVSNTFYAIDDTKRLFGVSAEVHYRVTLTTPTGTYASPPASIRSAVPFRDWRLLREMIRQELKRLRKYTGTEGYLLKRKRFGLPCDCVHPLTEEVIRPRCTDCYGTAIRSGYYAAIPDYFIEMGLESSREQMDNVQMVATEKKVVVPGKTAGFPLLNSKDVFIEKHSDRRWFIETITMQSELRSYPFKAELELRQANFADVIYQVPLTGS